MYSRVLVLVVFTSFIVSGVVGFIVWWSTSQVFDRVVLATPERSTDEMSVVLPSSSLPDMVEKVNPAVVSVVVTKDVPIYEQYYEEFNPWGDLWGGFGGFSVPRVRENGTEEREVGGGSGFIVSADGLVVTNRHVVQDTEARYSVLTNEGESFEVEVLARDPQLDIAVLKIQNADKAFEHILFGDSEKLRLGDTVVAIGNALGEFRNSVSVGVVSGLSRSITATDGQGMTERLDQVIQTDAAINPGNSGGPLLNLSGEVIGVNVATSRGADNIGFALPADLVAGVVASVVKTGKISRPFLGVRYLMVTESVQRKNELAVDFGALIARGETREDLAVMPGSPADRAGLRENDIILELDGERVVDDLSVMLRRKSAGEIVVLTVLRGGEEIEIPVELSEASS